MLLLHRRTRAAHRRFVAPTRLWLAGAAVIGASVLAAPVAGAQELADSPVALVKLAHATADFHLPDSLPSIAPAHALPAAESVRAATPIALGPRTGAASVRYAPSGSAPLGHERQQEPSTLRRHLALMAVGVGAIFIGSEVDGGSGTVLVLGGAGLSLYSLYQILQ